MTAPTWRYATRRTPTTRACGRREPRWALPAPRVQVRNPNGTDLTVDSGSFMSAALPVAGFMIVVAATLAEAVQLVSQTPCAVAHGVVEVWPLLESP
jgi:hypothetical protein